MDLIKPIHIVVNWLLQLVGIRTSQQKEVIERVIEYINNCLNHLERIMFFEKYSEDEIEYSRRFLQSAYHEIFEHLNGVASAKQCDIIRKSLMGGRIYYHAIKYGKVTEEQIKADYEDRLYAYKNDVYSQREFRQSSNEPVLTELVKNGTVISDDDRDYQLGKIITVCREDIERIESLREKLKTRKVLI